MTLHLLDGHTFETLSGEALELLADDAPWNQPGALTEASPLGGATMLRAVPVDVSIGVYDLSHALTDGAPLTLSYYATLVVADATHDHAVDTITLTYIVFLHVTTPPWNVTNITATRTLAKGSASADDVANFIGTLVYDFVNGIYDYTSYSITGYNEDYEYDVIDTTFNELFDVAGTVTGLPRIYGHLTGFVATNAGEIYVMDCLNPDGDTISGVLAALFREYTLERPSTATLSRLGVSAATVSRLDISAATVEKL